MNQRVLKWQHDAGSYLTKLKALKPVADRAVKILRPSTTERRDAGSFLNSRVDWSDFAREPEGREAYEKFCKGAASIMCTPLTVPQGIKDKLTAAGKDALMQAARFDLNGVDFGWFNELKNYDYWNLEENSPWTFLKRHDFVKISGPNFVSFIDWAKLRMIKGIHDKQLLTAINDVNHLAQLLYSTETRLTFCVNADGISGGKKGNSRLSKKGAGAIG